MVELEVSAHAIERYRERVEDLPAIEVARRLTGPIFRRAAQFGAPFVRLPTGQRAVLRDHTIITVLPPLDTYARLRRFTRNP